MIARGGEAATGRGGGIAPPWAARACADGTARHADICGESPRAVSLIADAVKDCRGSECGRGITHLLNQLRAPRASRREWMRSPEYLSLPAALTCVPRGFTVSQARGIAEKLLGRGCLRWRPILVCYSNRLYGAAGANAAVAARAMQRRRARVCREILMMEHDRGVAQPG